MDLPPSGWYPDPYGAPGLLRWWDGSVWTQHTHQDGGNGAEVSTQPAVQPTTVQPAVARAAGQNAAGQAPPTVPQAAIQPAAPQPAGMQPTTVQPGAVRPTTVQPTTVQPGAATGARLAVPAVGEFPDPGANGTQVLFLGDDAWAPPGGPGGGPPLGDRFGYQRAQRRRRIWLASGLAAGTVVVLAIIALVVNAMAQTSATPGATQSPSAPGAATTAPRSPAASPATSAPGSTLTDGQSGLSYTQLASPWQPTCPGTLNNSGLTWTAGESAVAGQVNGGQTTWYGFGCSGTLPQQYGYNGVADLENVANQLANQLNGTYYNGLDHSFQPQVSQPIQVSGHAGWEVKFLITYNNPQGQGLSWNDELGAVVVADNGGAQPSVFYTSVPGNLGETNVDALVSSLQLAVTPQTGSSPTDSAPATAPGPGNGGGDGHGGGGGNGP